MDTKKIELEHHKISESPMIIATIGVNEGYENTEEFDDSIYKTISTLIDKVQEKTGIAVSFNVTRQRTIYSKKFGCPEIGEATYQLTSNINPAFPVNHDDYIHAVKLVLIYLGKIYKQSTISYNVIDFSGCTSYRIAYKNKTDNN